MSLTLAMLEAAFDGAVPPRIRALVQPELADGLVQDFKVGLVFDVGGGSRPTRAAVSDEAEAARWAQTVRQQWPGAATEALLGMSRPGMRRMVDTDGSTKAEIYLDDLQAHPPLDAAEALRSPGDVGPAMCLSTVIPSGTRSLITRHTEPPFVHLVGPLAEAAADLVDQGAEGVWGLRWRMGQLVSVVWVTEARWRKNPELANGVAAGLGLPRAWDRCCAVLEQAGHLGYPDAIELHADGRVDITLGAIRAP